MNELFLYFLRLPIVNAYSLFNTLNRTLILYVIGHVNHWTPKETIDNNPCKQSSGLVITGGDSIRRLWVKIPTAYPVWTYFLIILLKKL